MVNQWFLYARSLKILLRTLAMFDNHLTMSHFTHIFCHLNTLFADIQNLMLPSNIVKINELWTSPIFFKRPA